MPFTVQQLADAAKVGLDFYMKNQPVDIVKIDRPFYKALQAKKKEFPGAKEYVVEQVRIAYQGNLQFYRGSGTVTYNTRSTIDQAKFPWRSAHDGLTIDEDRLAQNGITVTDDRTAKAEGAELIQLTNLLQEQSEVLELGFEEKFSAVVHLDGSASTDTLAGLDALVTIGADPTAAGTDVVGGIDRFTVTKWRNQKATGVAEANLLDVMETQYRLATRNGKPTKIFAGGLFIDAFRRAATAAGKIQMYTVTQVGGVKLDPSVTGLHFHGIEIEYCPEFDDNFGGMVSPAIPWSKRCYMLDMSSIALRPLANQDKVSRKPPRPSNAYIVYMALTWKGAMTIRNPQANAVIAIA